MERRPDAAELFRVEIGSGTPVIVVHGGPDFDHRYLRPELDGLSASVRLVYYDQRGRGRSYAGTMPSNMTMASEVDDLDRVRETLGLDSFVLLAHSWGCVVALEYAIRRPQAISGLVLMNAAPVSHAGLLAVREALERSRTAEERHDLARIRNSPSFRAGDIDADLAYYRIHYRPTMRSAHDVARLLPRLRAAFTPASLRVARVIEALLYADTWESETYDLTPQLRRVHAPALVLHGQHDFVPLRIAQEMVAAMPSARLCVIDDSGHFSYLDHTQTVCAEIETFIRTRIPRTPPSAAP